MEDVNLDTIIDTLSWYKTWQLSGHNHTRVNKNFSGIGQELAKVLGADKETKSDNSLEFGKSCEDLSWNHCTSTPHRSETNRIAERAVRIIKEGTFAVLLQSGLDEKMVGEFHGMLLLSAKHTRSLV